MEQNNNKPTSSRKAMNRVSKSGRQIKTPKAILTTSSDEAPPRRRFSKTAVSVKNELQRLRHIAKNISANKQKTLDKPSNKSSDKNSNKSSVETLNETFDKTSIKSLDKTTNKTSTETLNKTSFTETLNKTPTETLNKTSVETSNTTYAENAKNITACNQKTLDQPSNKSLDKTLNETLNETSNRTYAETFDKTSNKSLDKTSNKTSTETLNKTSTETLKKTSAKTSNETYAETLKKTSDEVSKTVPITSGKSISENVIEIPLPKRQRLFSPLCEENNEDNANGSELVDESSEQHSRIELKQVLEDLRVIRQQNVIIQQQNTDIQQQNDKTMQQLKLMFDELKQNNSNEEITTKLYERLEGFPLKTVDEFKKIETEEEKNQRKKLYYHLCNLGGSRVREFLSCALKETMTDELVNKFTWPGGQHSQKLGDTKIANVLYLAAKKCPLFRGPDTKAEFKTELQEVLRATKQRFRKLLKKSLQPEKPKNQEGDILQRIRQLEEELNNRSSEDEPFHEDMDIEADVESDNYY